MPLLDSEECEKMYHIPESSLSGKRLIQADMLCAGFAEGQRDACQVTGAPCFPPWHPCLTVISMPHIPGTRGRPGHSLSLCDLGRECFYKVFFLTGLSSFSLRVTLGDHWSVSSIVPGSRLGSPAGDLAVLGHTGLVSTLGCQLM